MDRGALGPASDVDVLIEFDPGARVTLFHFVEISDMLSERLGWRFDLVKDPPKAAGVVPVGHHERSSACNLSRTFVVGVDRASFGVDHRTVFAVCCACARIGAAVFTLAASLRDRCREELWR